MKILKKLLRQGIEKKYNLFFLKKNDYGFLILFSCVCFYKNLNQILHADKLFKQVEPRKKKVIKKNKISDLKLELELILIWSEKTKKKQAWNYVWTNPFSKYPSVILQSHNLFQIWNLVLNEIFPVLY